MSRPVDHRYSADNMSRVLSAIGRADALAITDEFKDFGRRL